MKFAQYVPDILIPCGGVAVSYGAFLVYPPAGWIVGGVFLIAVGVLAAIRGS